jgi:hypothetical protein
VFESRLGNNKINTAESMGDFVKYFAALGNFGPVLIISCAFSPGSSEFKLFSKSLMNSGLFCCIDTTCCISIYLILISNFWIKYINEI